MSCTYNLLTYGIWTTASRLTLPIHCVTGIQPSPFCTSPGESSPARPPTTEGLQIAGQGKLADLAQTSKPLKDNFRYNTAHSRIVVLLTERRAGVKLFCNGIKDTHFSMDAFSAHENYPLLELLMCSLQNPLAPILWQGLQP